MAVSVATYREDPLALESPRRDIQPPNFPKGDRNALKTRIKALVGFWEDLTSSNGLDLKHGSRIVHAKSISPAKKSDVVARDLFRPYQGHCLHSTAPPCYEDCLQDLPPDYTTTDQCATAQNLQDVEIVTRTCIGTEKSARPTQLIGDIFDVKVDLSQIDNIRSHANKKAKKAAKAAQRDKWADSDNEENKDGAKEGGEGNGEGGDAGAGGDGAGDPPGGGDDGDDWWDTGKKGKKDKKKKCVRVG